MKPYVIWAPDYRHVSGGIRVLYLALPQADILVSSGVVASARDPAEGDIFTFEQRNVLAQGLPGVGVEHNIVVADHHLVHLLERLLDHRVVGIPEICGYIVATHRPVAGKY